MKLKHILSVIALVHFLRDYSMAVLTALTWDDG